MDNLFSQRRQELIDEFELFDNWNDKYNYLIELGDELPKIDEAQKNQESLVHGCQSQVWIAVTENNGVLSFTADSDALIVKGVVALVLRLIDGLSPEEILSADWSVLDEIGLTEHLSMNRANGLSGMIKKITDYAKQYLKTT